MNGAHLSWGLLSKAVPRCGPLVVGSAAAPLASTGTGIGIRPPNKEASGTGTGIGIFLRSGFRFHSGFFSFCVRLFVCLFVCFFMPWPLGVRDEEEESLKRGRP